MTNGTLKFFAASVLLFLISSVALSAPIELEFPNGLKWKGEIGQYVQVDHIERQTAKQIIGELSRATDMYIVVDGEMVFISAIILIKDYDNPKPPLQDSDETSEENNSGSTSQKSSLANAVDSADFRWVIARGAGMSSDEAKNDAWRNAIEQVAGVLITSRSQIENEHLVEDKITAHSNAYIVEFQLIDENIESGIVRVQINAKVAIKILFEDLSKESDSLEFRNTDGDSMYASIVTQNQRTKSAIETLPAAMQGYPEELFDIKIGKTRMALDGVFKDDKEHLIVPITFSFNSKAWGTFSKNLSQYLKHVSSDTNSFKLRLQGLRLGAAWRQNQVDSSLFSKNSLYKQGWERALLAGDEHSSSIQIPENLKGMYDFSTVYNQVIKSYTHDRIQDVVVILDSRLKSGTSFAVSRDIWDSVTQRMVQIPAFYLNAMTSDGTDIGEAYSGNEFLYTTSSHGSRYTWFSSLHPASGVNTLRFNRPDSITDFDYHEFDRSNEKNSPRVIVFAPYFQMDLNPYLFLRNDPIYSSEYTYDYIINLELDEVKLLDRVEIEPYVLDLYNKKRRDNGEPIVPSPPTSDDNSDGGRGGPIGGPIGGGGGR
jgi:hypothetical protein